MNTGRITAVHRTRLTQILNEADALQGTLKQIVEVTRQVLDKGGQLHVESKISYLVGSYARLLKDLGVIEQLQSEGVSQRSSLNNNHHHMRKE